MLLRSTEIQLLIPRSSIPSGISLLHVPARQGHHEPHTYHQPVQARRETGGGPARPPPRGLNSPGAFLPSRTKRDQKGNNWGGGIPSDPAGTRQGDRKGTHASTKATRRCSPSTAEGGFVSRLMSRQSSSSEARFAGRLSPVNTGWGLERSPRSRRNKPPGLRRWLSTCKLSCPGMRRTYGGIAFLPRIDAPLRGMVALRRARENKGSF